MNNHTTNIWQIAAFCNLVLGLCTEQGEIYQDASAWKGYCAYA